jgi:hypothetical protein
MCAFAIDERSRLYSSSFKNRPRDRKAKAGSLWLCRYEIFEAAQMDGVAPRWQRIRRKYHAQYHGAPFYCPAMVGPGQRRYNKQPSARSLG